MLPSSQPRPVSQSPDLFHRVFNYPYTTDQEFQQGLRAILHSVSSTEDAEALTLNAQCFYYTRKHTLPPLNVDAYREWLQSQPVKDTEPSIDTNPLSSEDSSKMLENPDIGPPTDSSISNPAGAAAARPPYPTSFSQIVDLITNGQPIPGIKEVPDTLLAGQESPAVTAKRKKPWERDDRDNVAANPGVEHRV